ncbi:MAG: PCRF domain-containing protein, partial [Schleiferiaceae bacterium]|nr:PCRF domain-containing protein [Schleiferiaceae bacterium]
MNLVDKLQAIWVRHQDVHDQLMTPELAADPARFVRLNREYKELDELVQARARYLDALANRNEAQELLETEKDSEMRAMAQEEFDSA